METWIGLRDVKENALLLMTGKVRLKASCKEVLDKGHKVPIIQCSKDRTLPSYTLRQ